MKSTAAFRKEYKDLVHGLQVEQVKECFIKGSVINVLKNCDQKGRRVLIVNCGKLWDPSTVPSDEMFRMLYMVHIAAQLEEETQVRGVVCIMDFDGLAMKQVKALSPSFSKRLLTFIQDAMPLRMKEVHFVKQPFIFNMVWTLFKPFVKEKLNKRVSCPPPLNAYFVCLTNCFLSIPDALPWQRHEIPAQVPGSLGAAGQLQGRLASHRLRRPRLVPRPRAAVRICEHLERAGTRRMVVNQSPWAASPTLVYVCNYK